MRKCTINFLGMCIFCVFLCGTIGAQAAAVKPRIGIFLFKLDDIYIHSVAKNIEKNLEGHAEFVVFDAKNDQTLQTEQLNTFLNGKVDAVAVNLVDVKVSQHIVNMLRRKNIPLIFFNKEPNLEQVKGYALAKYVGTKAAQSGIIQGEIIANLWKENPHFDRNKDGICHFIMLQGGLDNPEALYRSRVSVQRARALGVKMQQVGDTLICAWDAKCAYNATKRALDTHKGQVDFIISNNDGMALGAIEALQGIGFNHEGGMQTIPVVGIDAIEAAQEAMTKGIMHGTVLQDAKDMAKAITRMLLNGVAKKPFLEGLPYSWDDSGIGVRIPYKAYTVAE